MLSLLLKGVLSQNLWLDYLTSRPQWALRGRPLRTGQFGGEEVESLHGHAAILKERAARSLPICLTRCSVVQTGVRTIHVVVDPAIETF